MSRCRLLWSCCHAAITYPVLLHLCTSKWIGDSGGFECNWNVFIVINQSIKYIYKALFTSADVTKCYTETQPKTPNSKQCRRRSKRKKPREEPSSAEWAFLFWLCRVGIITVHGQDVQTFIDDQQGQIIIISGCRMCNRSAPQQ